MHKLDLAKFAVLITSIGEVYGALFTKASIDIYWNVLKSFDFEEVRIGFYRHLKNPDVGRFIPKPADIVAAIEGNSQNQALQAWTKVVAAIQYVGCYNSIAFDDFLVHAVIEDMGGWRKICLTAVEQLSFVSREFRERYRGYVAKKPIRHPKYFVGIVESSNNSFGYLCKRNLLVLFGNKEKTKQVITSGTHVSLISLSNLLVLSSMDKDLIKN
ncbi:conserved hypothetical protein [Gammaproteobacteria bacterium]